MLVLPLKTQSYFSSLIGSLFLLSLVACDTKVETVDDFANCRYERPEAIFYDGLPQVSDHQFQYKGSGSEETFSLSGGIRVSILQYGCDYRTQEFIFELDRSLACQDSEVCTRELVQLFQALSRLGPEYHVFRVWSQAIKVAASQIRFGEDYELAEGFWVKLDQHQQSGSTTLMLTLSEKG